MTTAGRLQVTFMADQAALIALLQHEARVSQAYRAVRRRNAWHALLWGVVMAAAFGAWGFVRAASPEDGASAAWGRALVCAIVFAMVWALVAAAVLSPAGFYRLMDRVIQRRVESGAVEAERGPHVVTLVDEGIVCDDGWEGSRLALWSEVERIVTEEDAVYIDLRNGSVFRVPRLAFRGDVEFRKFVEFACGRVGSG